MSEQYTITAEAELTITPELMAKAFWAMDTVEQANFFEALANHIQETSPHAYSFGELHWCYLRDELRKPGREQANNMHMAISMFAFDFLPRLWNGCRDGLYP